MVSLLRPRDQDRSADNEVKSWDKLWCHKRWPLYFKAIDTGFKSHLIYTVQTKQCCSPCCSPCCSMPGIVLLVLDHSLPHNSWAHLASSLLCTLDQVEAAMSFLKRRNNDSVVGSARMTISAGGLFSARALAHPFLLSRSISISTTSSHT